MISFHSLQRLLHKKGDVSGALDQIIKSQNGKLECQRIDIVMRYVHASSRLSHVRLVEHQTKKNVTDELADLVIAACQGTTSLKSWVAGVQEEDIATMCEGWGLFCQKTLRQSVDWVVQLRKQVLSGWETRCQEVLTELEAARPLNALVETLELSRNAAALEALAQPVKKLTESGVMKDCLACAFHCTHTSTYNARFFF
jgi:hypothetical protein